MTPVERRDDRDPSEPAARQTRAALEAIRRKVGRMARARREGDSFWHHVLHLGVLGWMFVLPALAGALAGRFVSRWTGSRVAAVAPIALGLVVGAYAVWRQVRSSWQEEPAPDRDGDDGGPPPAAPRDQPGAGEPR